MRTVQISDQALKPFASMYSVDRTQDGRFHEQVAITFYKEAVNGQPKGLTIQYSGPDQTIMMPRPERPNWSLSLITGSRFPPNQPFSPLSSHRSSSMRFRPGGNSSWFRLLVLVHMQVPLTSEQQARLHPVAARTSKSQEQLVREGLDRMLDHDEVVERIARTSAD